MDLLANGASELGLKLSTTQLGQFDHYYRELADWSQRVNLTSITEHTAVQVKHFLDSLTVTLAYPQGIPPGLRIVDIGAGAGFPGLPLKLAFPDTQLLMVESVGKKARFLEHLVELLALRDVEVMTGRAEDLAHMPEFSESYDLALGRGVAKLPVLLEYTLPYCAVGGRLVVLNHQSAEREFAGAENALETLGGKMGGVYPVNVSGLTDDRIVVVVEKVRPTPEGYPRQPGTPAKRPL
ncbi:MAG: 16S rRNA (guanine(527)-N(7))-methyltransferase RsmG [SAR202 cluster bacterium Io17-Chloro-G4]|nr:MAG: 16S rRNA (guanine(527)-N(7))-methyltransferase RsmG [SAR202 cluster bacterium Io17-Chloro-G4]